MCLRSTSIAIVTAMFLTGPGFAQSSAQNPIILGKASYAANCASCHGDDATGGGPYSNYLNVEPIDLTMLSQNSDGNFPFSEVYQLIDGTKMARTHGDFTTMPVWGDYFMEDTLADRGLTTEDAAHIVQGRILSLVYYLESIQK